jgi:DNA-binding GntR family transcriptional regulator
LLRREGLIRRGPHGGYEVAPPTLKSVDDLFVAWRLIGPELVRLGVERASVTQLKAMREMLADYEASMGQSLANRVSAFYAHALALFELLTTAADSEPLTKTYRGMTQDICRVWYLPVADGAVLGTLRPASADLTTAFGRRDGELAVRAARDYITATHAQTRQLARSYDVISLDSERARRRTAAPQRVSRPAIG